MKTKVLLCGAIMALSFFISCDSKDNPETVNSPVSSDDVTINYKIDTSIDDVTNIVEDQYSAQQNSTTKTENSFKSILPVCATITSVLTDGVWTRTIDFGKDGCELPNGNVLKGKITLSFANNFTTFTRTISYSFEGFYHNGNLLEGNRTIVWEYKTTDLLATNHPVSTHTIDMNITFSNGEKYTKTGKRIGEMIEGFDTYFNWEDNVFIITGDGILTVPNGDKIITTITTPLRYLMSCKKPFPVSGIVSITKNDTSAILDFGAGTCDDSATITIDATTKDIALGK